MLSQAVVEFGAPLQEIVPQFESLPHRHLAGERNPVGDPKLLGARDENVLVRARADQHGAGDVAEGLSSQRNRIEQGVDAFGGAQFADIEKIGGVRVRSHGLEFGAANAIGDDPPGPGFGADQRVKTACDIGALEQEHVGRQSQEPFRRHEGAMHQASRLVVETAAMRRIGADGTAHRPQ